MTKLWRPLLALSVLVFLGLYASRHLELDHRLDAFLPAPADAEQALVIDQISAGPGGRLILAAISGQAPESLVAYSRQLAESWRELPGVARVDNGEFELDRATESHLMKTRFLLAADYQDQLVPRQVAIQLDNRLSELALVGRQIEPLIRRDPLGMLHELADRLASVDAPQTFDGIWLDQSGERALLLVVSNQPAFAIASQTELVEALKSRFEQMAAGTSLQLALGGAPVIAVDSASRSRSNAILLSAIGSAFLLLVLAWAWRSPVLVVAGALPLATGVVCGLVVTAVAFDQVHGLTLAFGFTLLGVALDYPIHLFGHGTGRRLNQAARKIRGPLLLGAASTLIAYVTIWTSTSPGLAQLGAFSAAGLAGAAIATLLLPALGLSAPERPAGRSVQWPYLPWVPLVLGLVALGMLVIQGEKRWSLDLTRLSPINAELLATDSDLRQAMGAGDVRYMLVIRDPDLETVLRRTEATTGVLDRAREQGLIRGWQAVTDLVPSLEQQDRRRAAWPDPEDMGQLLQTADPRFQAGAFDPFLEDLADLDRHEPIGPESWNETTLGMRVASLLNQTDDGWRSLVLLSGLTDADQLGNWAEQQGSPARMIDLRATSEAMVAAYRRDAGASLLLAMVLIAGLLLLRLRQPKLTALVLLPPLAAVMCAAAILSHFDHGLTIVHLIGLLLAGGIGLDLSLFSRTLSADRRTRAQTNRAVTLCAVSSGGVFLILGQSDIGMLRMLGLTVALGILLSWLFARLCQPPCRNL
ncbi:MAG: MMPL family transporter [Wenzhouxiangella sp.]